MSPVIRSGLSWWRLTGVDPVATPMAASDTPEQRFASYARCRDPLLLDTLLREHADQAFSLASRISGHREGAEDAVQEACVRLIATAGRYRPEVPFAAWLGRLVVAAAIDALRRETRQARALRALARTGGSHPSQPEGGEDDSERYELVRHELAALPARYREALALYWLGGLDQVAVASTLGVPIGTVAARLSRGLERLRMRVTRRGVVGSPALLLGQVASTPTATAPAALHRALAALARSPRAPGLALAAGAWTATLLLGSLLGFLGWSILRGGGAGATHHRDPPVHPVPAAATNIRIIGAARFQDTGAIEAVAFAPDGQLLATAGQHGLSLWTIPAGRLVASALAGHALIDCRYCANGSRILVMEAGTYMANATRAQMDPISHLELLDARTLAVIRTYTAPAVFYGSSCELSADGNTLIACSGVDSGACIYAWDLASGIPLPGIPDAHVTLNQLGHAGVARCRFSPDGTTLACLDGGGGITLWRWRGRTRIAAFPPPVGPVFWYCNLAWTADALGLMVTGARGPGSPQVTTVISAATGSIQRISTAMEVADAAGHAASLAGGRVSFSTAGKTSATWSIDPSVQYPKPPILSADGRWLAAAMNANTILLVDRDQGAIAPTPRLPTRPPTWLAFSADDRLESSDGSNLFIWSCSDGRQLALLPTAITSNTQRIGSRGHDLDDSGRLLLSNGSAGCAEVWDTVRAVRIAPLPGNIGDGEAYVSEAYSAPDGSLAVTQGRNGTLRFHDLHSRISPPPLLGPVHGFFGRVMQVRACAFPAQGTVVIGGGIAAFFNAEDPHGQSLGITGVWDPRNAKRLVTFRLPSGRMIDDADVILDDERNLAFLRTTEARDPLHPAAPPVVTGLWNVRDGAWLRAVDDPGPGAVFSRDGSALVSPSGVVSTSTGQRTRVLDAGSGAVLTPSATLVVAMRGADLTLVDVASGIRLATIPLPAGLALPRPGADASWCALTCSHGEDRVAIAGADTIAITLVDLFPEPGQPCLSVDAAVAQLSSAEPAQAENACGALAAADLASVPALGQTLAATSASERARRLALHALEWIARGHRPGAGAARALISNAAQVMAAHTQGSWCRDVEDRLQRRDRSIAAAQVLARTTPQPIVWSAAPTAPLYRAHQPTF